jgi:hypothetical protein
MNIQLEIDRDPILSNWMTWEIDSKHFDNQVNLKFAAIKIALNRCLNKI